MAVNFKAWRDLKGRRGPERRLHAADRYISRGQLEEGIRLHLAIAHDNPDDLAHLNRLGDLLVRAGRTDRAIALFLKVGRAYADKGFWSKAIAIYRKILRYDPGHPEAEARLLHLYLASGLPAGSDAPLSRRRAVPSGS